MVVLVLLVAAAVGIAVGMPECKTNSRAVSCMQVVASTARPAGQQNGMLMPFSSQSVVAVRMSISVQKPLLAIGQLCLYPEFVDAALCI